LLFLTALGALIVTGGGCDQILGLGNYMLCNPSTGAGGCGGDAGDGGPADANAAR
jgi:hypothetical protein